MRPGVPIPISADETVNRSRHSNYRCPICDEPVHLRDGDCNRPHSAHDPNPINSQNGQLFVSNSSPYDCSPQRYYCKKTGLPLYLEAIGAQFQFYLELPKLDEAYNEDMIDRGIEIQTCKLIRVEPIATVPVSELSEQRKTRIPLNQVEQEYCLRHAADFRLNAIPERTSAFYDEGTFFHVRSKYSRKVSFHGEMRVNVEYYLVTQNGNIQNRSFQEVIDEHQLITNHQNYVVYFVKFKEITHKSSNFSRKFNVELVESPTEFIPILPPMVYKNGSYILTKSAIIFGENVGNSGLRETSMD